MMKPSFVFRANSKTAELPLKGCIVKVCIKTLHASHSMLGFL